MQPPIPTVQDVSVMLDGRTESAPVNLRTKDVSDTLRLAGGGDVTVRWEEKKPG